MIGTSWLFKLSTQVMGGAEEHEGLLEYAQRVLIPLGASSGDLLVSTLLPGRSLDEVADLVRGGEDAIIRGSEITDSYSSPFGRGLLAVLRDSPPHHTQMRRFDLDGQPVLQVAIYPSPPASHGVRLWCLPALIWMFVEGDGARVAASLEVVRPSWERLRAHHGPPLQGRLPQVHLDRYPVANPIEPVSDDDLAELRDSIENLVGQTCVHRLLDGTATPRQAVDATLRGRRALTLHIDRVNKVLDFTHGDAETKVDLLREAVEAQFPSASASARIHLVAPHRHLVDGMRETQKQLAEAVAGASTTTALMSSAAVGRLLDRSRANRQASTAVAVGALLVAVLSLFTSLAAIPEDGREVGDLVRLGSWVGVGGILLVSVAYAIAVLSAIPADTAPDFLKKHAVKLQVGTSLLSLVLFVGGGTVGSGALLGLGTAALLAAALVRARIDDY